MPGSAENTPPDSSLASSTAPRGDASAAYEAYRKAGKSAGASYRTKFNARIKQSEVFQGADITPEVKALQRMTRYDRNKEYLDQIYYAIGNLYLSRRDTANAIANYVLAAEKSTRGGIEKAISQVTLGGLYFDRHRYDLAQPCYAEAVPQLPDNYPDLARLQRRSDVLDELAVYSQNVTLNDSLLRLAAMPEEQQLAVIDKSYPTSKERKRRSRGGQARGVSRSAGSPRLEPQQQFGFGTDHVYAQHRQVVVLLQHGHPQCRTHRLPAPLGLA